MTYTPISPFRRPVTAAMLSQQTHAPAQSLPCDVNKWEALKLLATARKAYGLSDRDITVLQALISFHRSDTLGDLDGLIVYPSNKTLCARLNGMPCSTMRRHLAKLIDAGILIRRDSPNGKRYARRYGTEKVAFGFDLRPLVTRYAEFCDAAEAVRAEEQRLQRLRETVSLMRRDLMGLAELGRIQAPDLGLWDAVDDLAQLSARALRRKPNLEDLTEWQTRLTDALTQARDALTENSEEMSIKPAQNEQHHKTLKKDLIESEERKTAIEPAIAFPTPPKVSLSLVLSACQDCQSYAETPIRHWHEFVHLANTLRPMMGVGEDAWEMAKRTMGIEAASVVLMSILERISTIQSPGGYLRHLTEKAKAHQFSLEPMVMALVRRAA
ncbi:plasmid replication protein RepC [Pseudoprimorskyibacter insulae]|uniref:Uncharacterized protein n=1 Tax=Pseudoprimorskyibacter insulae TaxID=1695997 RepID=A0A2R8AZK7_9RHOB|nr:plasmid replication protein RepC [Pseudoprimorskyibacter insulae]SPF81471.1 hypothetical protein PRI8871_03294 [Pseudoprimorskyibacter insulae]